MAFKRNLHTLDQIVRLAIGAGCLYAAIAIPEVIGGNAIAVIVGIFGATNIFAGIMRHCPVYHATGLSTHQPSPDQK